MSSSSMTLRAYMQINSLQPQFAAYTGATVHGSPTLAGDTVLIAELAPGNEVFRLVDVALKAAAVEATSQIVEREFGFFMLRSPRNSERPSSWPAYTLQSASSSIFWPGGR